MISRLQSRLKSRSKKKDCGDELPTLPTKFSDGVQNVYNPSLSPFQLSWSVLTSLYMASIVMHVQELFMLIQLNPSFLTMVGTFLGAGMEGIFLFAVMAILLHQTHNWLARVFAIMLGCTSVLAILSDFQFRLKTGGPPDMWVIMSGVKEFHAYLKGEIADDANKTFWNIFWALLTAAVAGCMVMIATAQSTKTSKMPPKQTTKKQMYNFLGVLFLLAALLYSVGAWMPIFNTYASLLGGFIFAPPGWTKDLDMALTVDKQVAKELDSNAPNVILIVHESMSGETVLSQDYASQKMPFVRKMMQSNKNDGGFYIFENSRTVSGDTADAFTTIASGCLPLNHRSGLKDALKTTIGNEFLKKGYQTVSISSRVVDFKNTKWFMLGNVLKTNFGDFFGPTKQEPLVNGPAADDLAMEKYFQNWLAKKRGTSSAPFYAQFYYFNSHVPFVNHPEISNTTDPKIGMLSTVDQSIENIFRMLEDSGELNNTIVIGTGDHGEDELMEKNNTIVIHDELFSSRQPGKIKLPKSTRLDRWNAKILHPLTYMYVPPSITQGNPELYQNLRHNTRQLMSTLDIFPTIMHILNGEQRSNKSKDRSNMDCILGVDLLATKITPHRMAYSLPAITNNVVNGGAFHMAVHYGTTSSLYKRYYKRSKYWDKNSRYSSLEVLLYANTLNGTNTKTPLTKLQEWAKILREKEGVGDENFEKIMQVRDSVWPNIVQDLFEGR